MRIRDAGRRLPGGWALATSVALHAAALLAGGSMMHGREPDLGTQPPASAVVHVRLQPPVAPVAATPAPVARPVAPPPRPAAKLAARHEARVAPPVVDAPPPQPAAPAAPASAEERSVPVALAGLSAPVTPTAALAPSGAREMLRAAAPSLAAYLHAPEPEYPRSAREDGEEGVVVVRVRVSRDGLPAEVRLERSSGSRALDRAAVAGVKLWRFVAASDGTHAVESWIDIPIRFRLG